MSKGIYNFVDKNTGMVVYIGKDSHIDKKKRIKDHYYPSNYDGQQFNRVLQNNSDRYKANIICEYPDLNDDELNYLEIKEILKHKFLYGEIPKFNYSIGGEGSTGYRHTDEAKRKIGKYSARYWKGKTGKNHHMYGKHLSDETKKKMSEARKGEKHPQWKNYPRILKKGFYEGKQIYCIRYNGKNIKTSFYIHKLYKWFAKNYPNEYLYFEVNQT